MRLRNLIDFLLVSSYCSGLLVASSKALVPEPPFNRTCCSNTKSAGVSPTRFLRASGGVVPNEIERTATAFLARIADTHFDPQQKKRKVAEGATTGLGFLQERLVETTKELFRQPEFKQWIEHVNEIKGKNPEQEISAIPTLTAHLGDVELYQILDVAITIPEYRNLAKKLQAEQMQHWIKMNKDPESVFDMFGLGKEGNIFTSPKFLDYVTYADQFIAKNPEKQTSVITTILKHHDVAIFIRQINQVKTYEDGEIKYVAIRLENDLMMHLVQTQPLSEALALLQLRPHSRMVWIDSICMKLLKGYVTKRADLKLAPISELIDIFGEDVVALWILTTKVDVDVGGKLESTLRAYWLSKDRSAHDIAMLLAKVSSMVNSNLFASYTRKAWLSYVDYLIENKPDMAKTFFTSLGTDVKTDFLPMIFHEAEQYPSIRRAIDQSPETMFLVLGLAENEEKVLKHPLLPLWLAYADSYSRRHPDKKVPSLLTLLYLHFGSDSFVPERINELVKLFENKQMPLALKALVGIDKANIKADGSPKIDAWGG